LTTLYAEINCYHLKTKVNVSLESNGFSKH